MALLQGVSSAIMQGHTEDARELYRMSAPEALAKIVWTDPNDNETYEFVLTEGATASIGRSSSNDIQIAEQHVSRQHAVVTYRPELGGFVINDLGSSNGTFVNDQPVTEPMSLMAGDMIRLYVPELKFAAVEEGDVEDAINTGTLIVAAPSGAQCCLVVTNGSQEGQTIPMLLDELTVGRAITNATWEILLQDQSISRPHARFERKQGKWKIYDLNSSNGTFVNATRIQGAGGHPLTEGDTLTLGQLKLLFRVGLPPQGTDQLGQTIPTAG